jgi:hypothetical protein
VDGVVLFVFGVAVGTALFPHLQRLADQVRRTLAKLEQPDQPKGPSPWS